MSVKGDLEKIVGAAYVNDDPASLTAYSQDQSFVPPSPPEYVVFPQDVEQIQAILKVAHQTSTPLVPYSSGLNLHGATIPQRGGIILNLTRMNTIREINEDEWFVILEPGVTYEQLQACLQPKGLRLMAPLGVPPKRSVLSSYLERDPLMAAASFEYGNHLLMDMEIVLPEGDLFRTGCWNLGGRPGGFYGPGVNMPFRFWTGAQGTLGVITKLVINVQHLSPVRKFFFLFFDKLQDAIEPLHVIQRKEIGWECFGLNRFNLAAFLTEEWHTPEFFPTPAIPSAHFCQLRDTLPPWTVAIGLTGFINFPEEKVAYEEETLRQLCTDMSLELHPSIPGHSHTDQLFLNESLYPWGILKKFCFRGSVHDLSFKIPLDKLPTMEKVVGRLSQEGGYPREDIGGYFLILERGRGVHVEFDLHCDLNHLEERTQVEALWNKSSQDLLTTGALFDRPYGIWSTLIYKKAHTYHQKLKQLKQEFDPKGIMNPGTLSL